MEKKNLDLLLAFGGAGLYLASEIALQKAPPHLSDRSNFSAHPKEVLGTFVGAATATYGLYRMNPKYAKYGVLGYVLGNVFLFKEKTVPSARMLADQHASGEWYVGAPPPGGDYSFTRRPGYNGKDY